MQGQPFVGIRCQPRKQYIRRGIEVRRFHAKWVPRGLLIFLLVLRGCWSLTIGDAGVQSQNDLRRRDEIVANHAQQYSTQAVL